MRKLSVAVFKKDFIPRDDVGADNFYMIKIRNTTQFRLIVAYVKNGMSFTQVAQALQDTKEILDVPKIGRVHRSIVSEYVRIVAGINLEHIRQIRILILSAIVVLG